jgi:hypothetical protein
MELKWWKIGILIILVAVGMWVRKWTYRRGVGRL